MSCVVSLWDPRDGAVLWGETTEDLEHKFAEHRNQRTWQTMSGAEREQALSEAREVVRTYGTVHEAARAGAS